MLIEVACMRPRHVRVQCAPQSNGGGRHAYVRALMCEGVGVQLCACIPVLNAVHVGAACVRAVRPYACSGAGMLK